MVPFTPAHPSGPGRSGRSWSKDRRPRPAGAPATPPPRGPGWESVAKWYDQHVGAAGSPQHEHAVMPAVLDLLAVRRGEDVLDVACGQGVLAPMIAQAGGRYTGVDASPTLVRLAQRRHAAHGRFLIGDVRTLSAVNGVVQGGYDALVMMLAIQDVDPLEGLFASAAWAARPQARIVIALTHPCFRVPRQSGWGWDDQRKLQYRRVDRYLTSLAVPMRATSPGAPLSPEGGSTGSTMSYHRPLHRYVNGLAAQGFAVDALREIPLHTTKGVGPRGKAEYAANQDIPQFLIVRAVRRS